MATKRILCVATIVLFHSLVLFAAEEEAADASMSDKANPAVGSDTRTAEEENAKSNAKKEWPDKIGPFEVQSKDKRHSLRLGLAVQLLFRVDNKDMGADADRENTVYAEARRVRPSLRGSLVDGLFEFYLHLNTSPNTLDLLDCYLNYNPHPYTQIRVGQWKIPFTRYRIQSFKRLTLVDWAITSKTFGAERQIGLAVHSGLEKPQRIDYAFGIFSGMNARSSHALGVATLTGEEIVSSSNLAEPGPKMEIHPELVARIGYNHNGIDVARDTDFHGGPFRFHVGVSSAYDLNADEELDFTARLAPEFLMKAYGFSLFLAGYLGWGERSMANENPELAVIGGLAQASYLFIKRVELAVRYSAVHNMDDFLRDSRLRADSLIAAADDPKEADDLTKQYKKVGSVKNEHEATFGINVYIVGESLKWQNDISYLLHDIDGPNKEDIRFRSQLQLAF